MFKVMIGLERREDLTPEQFREWWLTEHAPLARSLPGVRRIRFNVMEAGPFDGIAELWFDSAEAMTAAYATEAGERAAADSLAHVRARIRMPVAEHAILD